jgi:hypothetical protein
MFASAARVEPNLTNLTDQIVLKIVSIQACEAFYGEKMKHLSQLCIIESPEQFALLQVALTPWMRFRCIALHARTRFVHFAEFNTNL